MRLWFLSAILLVIFHQNAAGQAAGDFRTAGTGNWNNAATWQRYTGTVWVAATAEPNNASGVITILAGHVVTIPTGTTVTADQLVVNNQLVIAAGGQLTLADGTGTDLTATNGSSRVEVSGILARGNGSTIDNASVASRIVFLAGSEYRHQYTTTVGTLPTATWAATSTVNITGFTNTTAITVADGSWNQTLGNLIYNSPGQRNVVDFAGTINSVLGNVSILSTGTNAVQFSSTEDITLAIGGNFTTSGTARFILSQTGVAALNVQGDFALTSTTSAGSYLTYTGTSTMTVRGNLSINAGTNGRLHLANAGTTGNSTLNLYGNFTITNGRIDEIGSDPAQGSLRFLKAGTQTFTNTGIIAGRINTYIGPQTTLELQGESPITGASPASFVVEGAIAVSSRDVLGAIQNSSSRGNIRTATLYRTYATGSTVIYRTPLGGQFMGGGQPTIAGVTTVIDNAAGVTLAANVTLNGLLRLQSGSFNLGSTNLFTAGGNMVAAGGTLAGTSLSRLTITGTNGGSWGTMIFNTAANRIGILTLDRTGTNAGVTLNSSLRIDSVLTLNRGVFTNTSGLEMRNNATIVRFNTGSMTGAEITSAGAYNVTYRTATPAAGPFVTMNTGPELPSAATTLKDLTIYTAQTADNVSLAKPIAVNGDVVLTRGTLVSNGNTITMNGPSWLDNGGNFTASAGTVIFNGNTTLGGTTSTTFNHVQLNMGKTLTLGRAETIVGNINLQAGAIFNQGEHIITLSGAVIQAISANGATFNDINIAKSGGAGVQITSTLNLLGLLQFVSPAANINVASNGNLVLRSTSDAAGAANGAIYRLASGNTVSGNVTVERFMSGEGRIYRYLSSPVTNATVSQWKDDFPITGRFNDPSPTQTICGQTIRSNSPSLFFYDETVLGGVDKGYVGYPLPGTSTTTAPLAVGRGYSAFVRECTAPTVVDVTGPINTGTITFPVTYTATPTTDANGWNLVGNPYPSTIDWDVTGWTRTRMSIVISMIDNGTGMMRYYEPGVTNDIPGGQIAAGQAFFVIATGANPVLRATESVKVTPVAEYFRERGPIEIPSFSVVLSNSQLHDAAYVKLSDGALPGTDSLDAPKLYNPGGFSFATVAADSRPMAINAVSALSCNTAFPLEMKDVEPGDYNISLTTKVISGYRFMLTDKYTGKTVELKSGSYAFSIDENEASKDPHRFSVSVADDILAGITIESPSVVDNATANYTVGVSGTAAGISYTLVNADGTLIAGPVQGTGAAISFPLPANVLEQGTNELSVNALGGCSPQVFSTSFEVLKTATDELNGEKGAVLVNAYPNPVTDQFTLQIVDSNVQSIQVTTTMGQVITSVPVVLGQSSYTIDASGWGSGVYLMVVDKNSVKKSYRLIKK
jgi:hypothetical protein